jgi:hypothetical protein
MLDTRTYVIGFSNGRSDEYTADVFAENMYAQCDIEGRHYNLMEGIFDHKTDDHAVEPADMYIKHGRNLAGSAWWISRKATQLKLISMLRQRDCFIPLLLYGGTHISSRSALEVLLL